MGVCKGGIKYTKVPPKISAKELQNTKFDEKRKELKSAQEAKLSDQKHYIKQNKKGSLMIYHTRYYS